ncbi:hypothetical protein BDN67DRAFT_915867, partial [Paxillus ammoniavirescens]
YEPPRSHSFTPTEISQGINKLNRETAVDRIAEHPYNAIVEYPETGDAPDVAIAHVFNVNPHPDHFRHPRFNFQYSLGGGHGGRDGVVCRLLKSTTGSPVICSKLRTTCNILIGKGLWYCSFRPPSNVTHSFTSRQALSIEASTLDTTARTPQDDAHREVFLKTIGFYCALVDKGCAFSSTTDFPDSSDTIQQENDTLDDAENNNIDHARSSRRKHKVPRCHGQLVLKFDNFHQPYIQCSNRSPGMERAHLLLRNLQEFDISYLHSLLDNDSTMYLCIENFAKSLRIGPLAPSHWHRDSKNKLRQGALLEPASKCNTTYDIYVPNDLANCLQVLVVSRYPHNHPPPLPIKTPPQIVKCFESLLQRLEWKLADTTPRRLLLNSGFMQGLRQVLGWNSYEQDPSPHDLHPSLGNFDHLRRLINVLRSYHFPHGTRFQGAQQLASEQHSLPADHRYLRCAERYSIPGEDEFWLIICMTAWMSSHLIQSKRVSIDTSFKRVCGWQEFEIECWDNNHMRSVVSARAFTTSQSANAHVILFRRIFDIAREDTGIPVRFFHIHGVGIETVVADGHWGQALGLGRFCVELCRDNWQPCSYEPHRRMRELDPYDHLRRFLCVCITHFKRNIQALVQDVDKKVIAAMYSVASSDAHPNFKATLTWLKDKETSKFMIPALYQPRSLIPPYIWKASPSTTNGNEQSHRNANRDGIGLTLLAGIMRGQQCNIRVLSSIDLHISHGINTRDTASTYSPSSCQTCSLPQRYERVTPQ